jgi:3-phenylpropionate/trans-cinnamate dioxygenase ferredoxin component
MNFVKALKLSEIFDGKKKKVSVGGSDILFINQKGSIYALSDKCPHLGGSISKGILEKNNIKCPNHGAEFDIKTGKCVFDAKILFINMKVKDAVTYPVKIEGDDILVGL